MRITDLLSKRVSDLTEFQAQKKETIRAMADLMEKERKNIR